MLPAIVRATRLSSETDANSTSHTPSGNRSRMAPATSSDRRVFPAPPGPTSVTSRLAITKRAQLGQLAGPPDERGERGREVVQWAPTGVGTQGARRAGEFRVGHLVDALRPGKVRQIDLAGVNELDLIGQEIPGETGGGLGAHDVSSGRHGEETGGAVQGRPEPVVPPALGRPGVDRHANPERDGLAPVRRLEGALAFDRRADGGGRRREGDAQPVTGVSEDVTVPGRADVGQDGCRGAPGRTPWRRRPLPTLWCWPRCR